jgi:hypothetical protein
MHGRAFKAEHRLVNHRDEIRVGLQQLPHAITLTRFDCQLKEFDWRLGQRLDLSLHAPSLWQTIEYAAYSVVHLISNQWSFYNRQLPEAFDSKRTSGKLAQASVAVASILPLWEGALFNLEFICASEHIWTNKRQR